MAHALSGTRITLTGRLASMTRDEAVDAISAQGGSVTEQPDETTSLVVVGAEGWPFQKNGELTRALRSAQQLEQQGRPIRIVTEDEFLDMLGVEEERPSQQTYTLDQLARILDVDRRAIRRLVHRGLIQPTRVVRRLAFFDFQEVARAKALHALLEEGVRPGALVDSIEKLERWLPDDARVAAQQLERIERGQRLLMRLDDGSFAEPSGQLQLPFDEPVDDPILERPLRALPAHRTGPDAAREWFAIGVDAEDRDDLEEAAHAYHQALLADVPRAEIHFNLGNVLHAMGRLPEASQRYMVAVELEPDYVEAWNNLGNSLSETDRLNQAVEAYERALALEPEYADAHFNLAETLQQLDRFHEAVRHWRTYLRQSPNAHDRKYVERMIAECEAITG